MSPARMSGILSLLMSRGLHSVEGGFAIAPGVFAGREVDEILRALRVHQEACLPGLHAIENVRAAFVWPRLGVGSSGTVQAEAGSPQQFWSQAPDCAANAAAGSEGQDDAFFALILSELDFLSDSAAGAAGRNHVATRAQMLDGELACVVRLAAKNHVAAEYHDPRFDGRSVRSRDHP